MTEADVAKAVHAAGGDRVRLPRRLLRLMWGLRSQKELSARVDKFCEASVFDYDYDQPSREFEIRLKAAPKTS